MPLLIAFVTFFSLFVSNADAKNCVNTSYYWQGKKTASGERFNPHGLSAAHRTLPFGTILNLRNPKNNKTVTVRINDRGPFIKGRHLDISLGAANALNFRGVGKICY